jgi:hypothetical protein
MGGSIITGAPVGAWVAGVLGRGYFAERSQAIGLERDGIQAGVIYEDWSGRSIVCHIAIEGRLTSCFVAAIFDYPFRVCGVEKIIAPILSGNAKALRLVKNMGFVEEARLRFSDEDLCMMTMNREQCRFLGAKYEQKSPAPPPAPDYAGAAQQQGVANLEAARLTARLSNPNIRTPLGGQRVSWGRGQL